MQQSVQNASQSPNILRWAGVKIQSLKDLWRYISQRSRLGRVAVEVTNNTSDTKINYLIIVC